MNKILDIKIILISNWTYIIGLSQIFLTVSELAVLSQWTLASIQEMFAHLSFIFLFQCVELTLISVEIVVVRLLSQMPHNFAWWVIEVSRSAICIETFTFIPWFFTWWMTELIIEWVISSVVAIRLFVCVFQSLIQVNLFFLLWSLRIGRNFFRVILIICLSLT